MDKNMYKTIKRGLLKFYQEKLPFYITWGVVIIWILLAVIFAIVIIMDPRITYDKPSGFIGGLSTACITISSIILAAIYAIITIIGVRSPEKVKKYVPFSIIPIVGISLGLFSLYFSFFENTFPTVKFLIAFSMGFTIISFIVVYLITNKLQYLET